MMHINTLSELGWSPFFQSQLSLQSFEAELPLRVMSVQRNRIECQGLDAGGQPCLVPVSTYAWRDEPVESHPTVGDWLMFDRQFTPLYLLQRKSLVKRRSAGRESLLQLIAANIDTLFIVTSCNDEFNINRIERYLSLAAESQLDTVVVLTKSDLCADSSVYLEPLRGNYPRLPVETMNATQAADVAVLQPWCGVGQTVALVGSSGVGKSTIINSLIGDGPLATAGIREADSKGRHTTTARSLHRLSGGGILLDTPGMRELRMVDNEQGIQSVFADIEQLATQCRFQDCRHVTEPGCAVQQAIQDGQLEARRLENYLKLIAEQARNSESLAQRRQHDRALGRFYRQALHSSRRFKSEH